MSEDVGVVRAADSSGSTAHGPIVKVSSECASVLNFAMDQNGVPLIREVRVRNDGSEPLSGLELEARLLPDFSDAQRLPVPALAPGEEYRVAPVAHRVTTARLRELTETERGQLVVKLEHRGAAIAEDRQDVRVLAVNEWPGAAAPAGLLAAFVTPNHPVVTTLLQDVREKLRANGQVDGLEGYQSGRPDRTVALMQALYQAVQALGIGYVGAPPSFEDAGQKIRLPDAVLRDRLACCLDISVLFAAALEGMGLAPLLLLVRGHAFVGVWLRDERFPEGVVLDAARLRTQVELGTLLPLDATAVTATEPVLFDASVRMGVERLARDEEFHCVVDVRALRSEYRPIPLRIAPQDGAKSDAAGPEASYARRILARAAEHADEPGPPRDGEADSPASDVDVRFRRWKERLLDLTLRNRLLSFKPDAKSALRLEVPDLEAFEDGLWENRSFQLLPRPDRDARDERDPALADERVVAAAGAARLVEQRQRKVHCRLTSDELWTRLKSLDRDARTALEEGGAVVLHAGIGFLRWFESATDTEPCLAPLLLYPVELVFDARVRRTSVRRTADDPVLNVTLVERLRRDFGVDASELSSLPMAEGGGNETGVAVAELLRRFRVAIQRIPRWEVVEDVHLGMFQFTKFLMWKDLEDNAELFLRNAVVRRIASREAVPLEQSASVGPENIDLIHPSELPTVMDADSTQMAAIASALDGQSFVLQGPPGTGKSQTIANLIAASLAHGRTVLFVSEKMAALDVVHRRLRDVGLGDFCLELHSHKANKKDVVASLHAALTHCPQADASAWKDCCDAVVASRAQLNGYVEALHRAGPLGVSVHEARGRLFELEAAPDVRLPPGFALSLDAKRFAAANHTVEEFAALARSVEPVVAHPFAQARCATWSAASEERLRDALADAGERAAVWQSTRNALARQMRTESLRSDGLAELARACATLEVGTSPAPAFAEDWPQRSARARACVQARRRAAADRDRLGLRWAPSFVEAADEAVVGRFKRWASAFFVLAWIMLFTARRHLRRHAVGRLGKNADVLTDLLVARRLRSEQSTLDSESKWVAELLATPAHAPPDRCDAILVALDGAHPAARRAMSEGGAAARALEVLRAPMSGERQRELAGLAGTAVRAEEALRAAEAAIAALLECGPEALGSWSDPAHPGTVISAVERWTSGLRRFRELCLYRGGAAALAVEGLSPIAEAHERGAASAAELGGSFEKAVLRQWHAAAVDSEGSLRDFEESRHAHRVEEFRALDRQHIALSRQYVIGALEQRLPSAAAAGIERSEPAILMREAQKKSRLLPVRRLLREIPTILPRLKPCFLMSPLSVAQYLPAEACFDVVVFDEASQICTHEAIGAIARGKQVIIVGDSRQMPPTSFFARKLDGEDDIPDENDVVELESVLDEAVAKLVPQQWLQWHYRSRHQSLIDFSNRKFYESRLDVFPAAELPNDNLGIAWHRVNGVYQGGSGIRGCTNRIEAEAIVAHLVERLCRFAPEERTFGVVTFNIRQQRLILDLLDEARLDPLVDRHFAGLEPVFVKNLESVQGDERDEIAFSICNAPDTDGRFSMAFGAVNLSGGERRLNVAVTRARKQLVVFASFDPERIDRARTKSKGAWLVREFLQYARENGGATRWSCGVPTSENAQDRAVAAALRDAGFGVQAGVGCGRYRLDAAVLDPVASGRFAVAVEADGAMYRSATCARDRDRLRADVLQRLDWQVERVWSSGWWYDSAKARGALIERVRGALARPRPAAVKAQAEPPVRADSPSMRAEEEDSGTPPEPLPRVEPVRLPEAATYQSYAPAPAPTCTPEGFYEPSSAHLIGQQLIQAIETEGPIHQKLLAQRVLDAWGISSVTARPTRRLSELLQSLERAGRVIKRGEFFWPTSREPGTWQEFRGVGPGKRAREMGQVAPEEIANAAAALLREAGSLDHEDLLREVAALFGVARVGQKVREAIDVGLEVLASTERCSVEAGRLRLTRRS